MRGKQSNKADIVGIVAEIMAAEDRREAFRSSLLNIGDEARAELVIACQTAINAEKEVAQKAQKDKEELDRIERELFGTSVVVSGNHRADSKGKLLTLALERGATMDELKAIRGAVPQHLAYLRRHGFDVTLEKSTGIYRAVTK